MHGLLQTVPAVVSLKPLDAQTKRFGGKTDFVEGNCCAPGGYKNLSGPHSMEANMEHVYADPANYDWPLIAQRWSENWSNENPYAQIRLQKTPADIFRIAMIAPFFHDLKWIVSVRNPYAYVESIMRKASFLMEPLRQLDQVCFHVLRTLEIQIQNAAFLGTDAYVMTYEDFVARPEHHRAQMAAWLPGLEYMDFDAELIIKGQKVAAIADDSPAKVRRMITEIPDINPMINEYFAPCESLLNHWGYELMKAH